MCEGGKPVLYCSLETGLKPVLFFSWYSINPWQQQLMMLKDKALERDANTLRLMTSPTMLMTSPTMPPPATPTPSSLALLRSFAALSEKMPQAGFEPGQSDGQRALSALQQV